MSDKGICPCCGDWAVLVTNRYNNSTDRWCEDCHKHE
jgi:hypothetical protein